MSTDASSTVTTANSYAAIDLGSNSFHMVIAENEGESIRIIDSLRHPVRLASGLDDKKNITEATQSVAFDTLAQFAQRLRGVQRRHIRIVGTNTLRRARNAEAFMQQAGRILGKEIEIISGREEARLIYSAVSHTLPDPETQRLVVDIGGGSTELIIGTGQEPFLMESVNMGCVSYSQRFINSSKLALDDWERAAMEAQLELQPIKRAYRDAGWTQAIGCSGTIKATSRLLVELGISDGEITRTALKELRKRLIAAGSVENLAFESISGERTQVIIGGIAILHAILKTLRVERMEATQVALREGLIFDMIGQEEHMDLQTQTLANLMQRYSIDPIQSRRVRDTAMRLYRTVAAAWTLDDDADKPLLGWAAQLHELGMGIAHTQYHKHGAYILENSDLLGFSFAEQHALALLVRNHRRKIDQAGFEQLTAERRDKLLKLLSLLRIAVLLHRDRHYSNLESLKIKAGDDQLTINASDDWLSRHPLTAAELGAEAERQLHVGIRLKTRNELDN